MDFWSYWTGFYIGFLVGILCLGSALILYGQFKVRRSIRQKKDARLFGYHEVQSVTVTEQRPEELKGLDRCDCGSLIGAFGTLTKEVCPVCGERIAGMSGCLGCRKHLGCRDVAE